MEILVCLTSLAEGLLFAMSLFLILLFLLNSCAAEQLLYICLHSIVVAVVDDYGVKKASACCEES